MEHLGKVIDSKDGLTRVEVLQVSACSGCEARSACGLAESKRKVVEVDTPASSFREGAEVVLSCETSMGLRAVWYAFVLPLLLVVLALVLGTAYCKQGGVVALLSLLVLVPYYGLLYVFREKMKRKFTFTIK